MNWTAFWDLVIIVVKILAVVGISQGTVAYLILLERRIAAWAQDRIGPNRVGPFGLIQALVDGAKMVLKEDVTPGYVAKPVYILAPAIAIIAATIGFAVVPFGPVGETAPSLFGHRIDFQIAPGIDIGVLYILSIGSLAVYAVILAGWASNSKYSFLGGLRSSAQLISYEIPLGLSILGMVLITGTLDLNEIVNWQDRNIWGCFAQPIGFLLFLVSGFAETNRLPFDLPESEQELVGGFHTEYSSLKFGMFFLGEYLHVITVSFVTVILFFGGWDLPFVLDQEQTGWIPALAKLAVISTKVLLMIIFMMWIRWTLPRFRYDTLMDLAWKRMIPLALINLTATACLLYTLRDILGFKFY
ncbi:NADH-quinone oxidoreductase subunit NuoH [Tundrisphaera lichenicola]|uniref:NADH-quinone oxidoreductase subunit NuoH n=1 Tax=Tundrisphaera lichenicola TaxID=2029860 RepID=UPI003EB9DF82